MHICIDDVGEMRHSGLYPEIPGARFDYASVWTSFLHTEEEQLHYKMKTTKYFTCYLFTTRSVEGSITLFWSYQKE